MLDEFARYSALQRDQAPLASLLIYLRRKGGFIQLNCIWREMGPTAGGPFWNQTTLINKLDKLERLGVLNMERRILPSPRAEAKKKTNTFYRMNPETPLYPYIFSMLRIFKKEPERYSSELVQKPLERLCLLAGRGSTSDPLVGRELDMAMKLIGDVFSVGQDEVKRMIQERMERKGVIRERRWDRSEKHTEDISDELKNTPINAKIHPKNKTKPQAKELATEDYL
jgi:hypothetical protein